MPPPATGNLIVRAQASDADGRIALAARRRLGRGRRRPMVRRVRQRPHRSAAGEEALRAGRDGALPGAHAVQGRDRARHRRARRRARRVRHARCAAPSPCSRSRSRAAMRRTCSCRRSLVRGRIGGIAPTALIDLGKPAYKMGLAEMRVGWAAHELAVKVTPARDAYKVREKASRDHRRAPTPTAARRRAAAKWRSPRSTRACSSSCPTTSWKLLDAMMARRGEEVETSTAQMQVIGKRHFGRKAVPAGGGGGRGGRARAVRHAAPVAGARAARRRRATRRSRFRSTIRSRAFASSRWHRRARNCSAPARRRSASTQDLMLLLGPAAAGARGRSLPRRRSRCATRRSDRSTSRVTARMAAGRAAGAKARRWRPARRARCPATSTAPLAATSLALAGRRRGTRHAGRRCGGAATRSRSRSSVVPAVPERTYQATILQLTAPQTIPVQRPADAIPGRGGINVQMQAKLAGELPGVRDFLRSYPSTPASSSRRPWPSACATARAGTRRWARCPTISIATGCVKFWPLMRDGERRADRVPAVRSPTKPATRFPIASARAWSRRSSASSKAASSATRALPTADLAIRKVAALEALSRRTEPLNAKWLDSIHDRAQSVADVGGDRLVPDPQARSRSCRATTSASRPPSRSCARA